MPRFLVMESCNFIDYPKGGQATVAKQIMTAYKQEVALVGITTEDNIPVGKWTKVYINNTEFDYFAVTKVTSSYNRPLIPMRLQMYLAFKKYKKDIFSLGIHKVLIQSPEILFAVENLPWESVCVNMPGITNPLSVSRYRGVKYFGNLFDFFYLKSLRKVEIILASADNRTINNFIASRGKNFNSEDIIPFPTRVETDLFHPIDKNYVMEKLKINGERGPIFIVTGRLTKFKGWKLIIDAFIELKRTFHYAKLYFIGDGEEKLQIERYIYGKKLVNHIVLVGAVTRAEVALWINAANVVLIGSFVEGWSLAMNESVACCKPIVSTDISGARDLIKEGVNGFVCKERDSKLFAEYIKKALSLDAEVVRKSSLDIIERYALYNLKNELDQLWKR